jgi:hypothetical protein
MIGSACRSSSWPSTSRPPKALALTILPPIGGVARRKHCTAPYRATLRIIVIRFTCGSGRSCHSADAASRPFPIFSAAAPLAPAQPHVAGVFFVDNGRATTHSTGRIPAGLFAPAGVPRQKDETAPLNASLFKGAAVTVGAPSDDRFG